ncbi:BREX-2 system adenine-specific DNA-methyltransferase PglX [Paractinoplanes rishiriensis]|uniref:site-specific DNA-methyltransferase (adenine-specific) n=1 Tax=Paractinoplanes rishiriensis TaxID=1050105 RepID=A0A919K462_9ACTN|nr:BREX-2 system adenine-specific DNA-methyltransferase PglX [Actinoplanes rishiriensis]GIF00577.1 DNA methylase [Actinoplanes rishiriensis]
MELKGLRDRVADLVDDLRDQAATAAGLRAGYAAEPTAATFETWLDEVLDQAAVAWVLGCVFVRFCGDNGWIPARLPVEAGTDRDRLLALFGHLARLPATARLFDEHNPVWRFTISERAAARLVAHFHRERERLGPGTRFLGDLYQGLSAHARRTYGLVQTPDFVENFILDRTLEPARREFGLPGVRVVDPACGAGHFLVGAFDRLLRGWRAAEPGTAVRVLVERALRQVTGMDLDPFAVAIAHFRLSVAAMSACGVTTLDGGAAFEPRLLVGDALLAGDDQLPAGAFTVVVGNPPYQTVKDRDRDREYRRRYPACSRKYALTVPFTQLFFRLARPAAPDGTGAGVVGQITANSFMRREFGRKLVTAFLATEVELTEVIDTSGAYLPGYGTPTVILIGRNRPVDQRWSGPIRTVLGVRGEPGQPPDPARGHVWSAIAGQIDRPGSSSAWVSVVDADRDRLARHPWSLSGGGADLLTAELEAHPLRLRDRTARIGVFGMTNADDVLLADRRTWLRRVGTLAMNRRVVVGDELRDWSCEDGVWAFFPYDESLHLRELTDPAYQRWLWPVRTVLGNRATFRGRTYFAEGRPWYGWHQVTADPDAHPWWIAYAFMATHNHFVLDRGGRVFKQSAPVLKLPATATEDDHLGLLGLLNSSIACFWLKQVSHNKGSTVDRRGARQTTVAWENFYEFTATKLQQLPLPPRLPVRAARYLDDLGRRAAATTPQAVAATGVPDAQRLAAARAEWTTLRYSMIGVQEELDWAFYRAFGLIDEDLVAGGGPAPRLRLGERAFEIALARRGETQWFERHGSVPVTTLPRDWPPAYRALVERRLAAIAGHPALSLVERPEYKRRWAGKDWPAMQDEALRDWLLDRLESAPVWTPAAAAQPRPADGGAPGALPAPLSIAQLAARVAPDAEFRVVLALWSGADAADLTRSVAALLAGESVPFLAAHRFTRSGLRKYAQWERTWALQRRVDAGETVEIPVPPRYRAADFRRVSYWRHRGALDVPRERFIAYPGGVLGLAAWNHAARAQALASLYRERERRRDRPVATLLPLLAGLAELEPWLAQWHRATEVTALIDAELARLGADRSVLTAIRGLT